MAHFTSAAVAPWSPGRALSASGAVVIGVLAWRLGTGPFLEALRDATMPALGAAVAIGGVTTALSALRWVRAAHLLRLPLPPAQALTDYYAALFLNAVLPGGVLGDVRRAARHGRAVGSTRSATAALLVERSAGQTVLVLTAAAVWLVDPHAIPGPAASTGLRVASAVVAVGIVVAAVRLTRLLPVGEIRDMVAMLGAAVVVLAGHLAMFLLAARTAGVEASVVALLPLGLVALLAMSLPLNLAGWGPREGATAWAFAGAGLGAGRGVTVAVLYGLFTLLASLPGALVLLSASGLGRRARPAGRA